MNLPTQPHQRDEWPSMDLTPDKGPIRFLEKHLIKYNKNINLELIPILYPNIDKWIANDKIDNEYQVNIGQTQTLRTLKKHAF